MGGSLMGYLYFPSNVGSNHLLVVKSRLPAASVQWSVSLMNAIIRPFLYTILKFSVAPELKIIQFLRAGTFAENHGMQTEEKDGFCELDLDEFRRTRRVSHKSYTFSLEEPRSFDLAYGSFSCNRKREDHAGGVI